MSDPEAQQRRGSSNVVVNVQTPMVHHGGGHGAHGVHGGHPLVAPTLEQTPAFTPISPAVEPEVFEMTKHPVLDERLDDVTSQIAAQREAVVGVTAAQRELEVQRATALSEDRRIIQEQFRYAEEKVEDHWQVIRAMQQQQDHILKLVHLGTKVNEQDRNIRRFVQYQTQLVEQMQAPIKAQAEAMKVLQATQFRLLGSMEDTNVNFTSLGAMTRGGASGQYESLSGNRCPSGHDLYSIVTLPTDDRTCVKCQSRFARMPGLHLGSCGNCNTVTCLRCVPNLPANCLQGHPLQSTSARNDLRIPCSGCGSVPDPGASVLSCESGSCRYLVCDQCLSRRAEDPDTAGTKGRKENVCMVAPHALGQKTYHCSCVPSKEDAVLCESCAQAHVTAGHRVTEYESKPEYRCSCGNSDIYSEHCERHKPRYDTAQYSNEPVLLGGMLPFPMHDPQEDAKELRRAMKGLGTNEKKLIHIIGTRTNRQRQAIAQEYDVMTKRSLYKDVKSETSGDFGRLLLALLLPPAEYDAELVHEAVKGLGTDDTLLMEVLCSRTNAQVEAMKKAYKDKYQHDMEADVRSDTSGSYQKLLIAILQAKRDSGNSVDMTLAKEDAANLYAAGEGRVGTKEAVFIEILTRRNYAQLRATFDHYAKLEDFDIEKSIKRETSGKFQNALRTLVKFAKDRRVLFATLINMAMQGTGTDERRLLRNIVVRSEIDLKDIAVEYHKLRGKSLGQAIRSEVRGYFRKLLLEVLGDSGFDPQKDAKRMRNAMRGFGAKKTDINKVLAERSNAQRQDIATEYERMYKRNLLEDLKSETGNDYQKLIIALMTPPLDFLAQEVHRAIKGLGTDDASLIELICARSSLEMRQLKERYMELYKKPLTEAISGDTSGWYKKLLISLVDVERDESGANPGRAKELAAKLYRAGEKKWGTDEQVFIDVFTRTSHKQLIELWDEYSKISKYGVQKAVEKETSFNFRKALVTIIKFIRNKEEYYAERLHRTMKGLGTQDYNLIRLMVTRHEIDLKGIMKAFFEKYKLTLDLMIEQDTSFQYKDLLVRLTETCKRYRSPRESEKHRAQVLPSEIVVNVVVPPTGAHGGMAAVGGGGMVAPHGVAAGAHGGGVSTSNVVPQVAGVPGVPGVAGVGAPGVQVQIQSSGPILRYSLVGSEMTQDGDENEPEIYFQLTETPGHGTGTFIGRVDYGDGQAADLTGNWNGKNIQWHFIFPGDNQRYDFKGKMSLGADQTLNTGDTISGTFTGGDRGTFQYQIVEYHDYGDRVE
eukprot:m.37936 g.37936  ORF g.37936 m.37936 type:complete len:1269 (+) comp11142_c0_seq3:271-4077(+)